MLDGEDEEKVFQLEPDRNKHNNQKEKKETHGILERTREITSGGFVCINPSSP